MIREAAKFATKAHKGMVRKGTNIPYINHPLDVAVIVSQITRDEEIIAAALLHDVLEDTKVTREELENTFGLRVAALVAAESEDKTKIWRERKQNTIIHLTTAIWEEKVLALGDKVSNMRDTARDYLVIGDEIWQRFNDKKKENHAWYYNSIIKNLEEFSEYHAYHELVQLYEYVFGG